MHPPALRQQCGERGCGIRVVGAVEPGFDAIRERAVGESLEAGGPGGAGDGAGESGAEDGQAILRGEHLPGEVGIADLVRAGEGGDKRRVDLPVALFKQQSRADACCHLLDRSLCFRELGKAHQRHAAPRDAGFLRGNLAECVAQEMLVVEADAGNPGDQRPVDDIGRIEPPAEPDFEHHRIRRRVGKGEHRGGGVDLEQAAADQVIGIEYAGHDIAQPGIADQCPRQPDALVVADEVRTREDVHPVPRRFHSRAQEGAGRSLAVGPGDMEHRRQPILRATDRIEQGADAVEPDLVVVGILRRLPRDQRREPGVVGPHHFLHQAAFFPFARPGAR